MLLTFILTATFFYIIWKYWIADEDNPLDRLPGPPKRPIIGSVLEFANLDSRNLFGKMREFAEEYGDRYVVKVFKRRILHLSNVDGVEIVLSHSRNIKKSKPYTFLQAWLGTGLLLSAGAKWHKRRKILTPAFHFNILKKFSEVIEEKSRDFVRKFKGSSEVEVNVMPAIRDFTLVTICETAMGTQLDSDKSASTAEYKTALAEIGSLLLNRVTKVWLHNEFIFRSSPIGRKFRTCLEKVHRFADNVIEQRRKQRIAKHDYDDSASLVPEGRGKKRLALLDLLLDAESKGEIDLEGIKDEVNTFMFEGYKYKTVKEKDVEGVIGIKLDFLDLHSVKGTFNGSNAILVRRNPSTKEGNDTTAMALTFALMLIADHEEVQVKIFDELQQIFESSDRTPSSADYAEMKYLESVIKETLRLYPSVPFIAREITEDFILGNLPVKKGSEVAVHIYDLHRRKDLYTEPELFRPERFSEDDTRRAYAFVPFSAGPRNCIGQRFAMLEMKCLLSEICRNYELEPRVKGWRPTLVANMLIQPAEDIYVKFKRR